MKTFIFFVLLFTAAHVHAVEKPINTFQQDTLSKGIFILHKFQQPIGKEKYAVIKKGDSVKIASDFKFNDRGNDVILSSSLTLTSTGIPVLFNIKGGTSRFSEVNSEVRVVADSVFIRVDQQRQKAKISKPYFTISGYSPVAVQMAMIKYWNQRNRPASLPVYPSGNIIIRFDGRDTITHHNKKEILERYFVHGLIWGKEMIWTDQSGNLITLFTNDAEGDKFEAIQEAYVDHLPFFIRKAALYGMQDMKLSTPVIKDPVIVLKGGDVLDVISGNLMRNTTIIVKDGKIKEVGSGDKIKIPKGAKVMNIPGKTVLPGLWDMHAHFQQVEWGPAYLAAGVTTVRDCGNEFDFINAVEEAIVSGKGLGPHILKAGIIDGDSKMALGIIRANSKEDAQAAVRKYKDNGFDQIKIYSSVKPEIIKAIADEAHKLGLTVTGHVPEGVTVPQAIEAGQDQINHFTFLYRAMLTDRQRPFNIADSSAQSILKLLKDRNVVVDPTLGVYEWVLRPLDQPMDAFEPGVNHVSEELKAVFKNIGMPAEDAAKRKFLLESGKVIVLALHNMGIPIVAGTDMLIPGYSLFREIELYHEAGLTPIDAIRTATIVPARVMKMDALTGSIDAGKQADLIILDGNPLEKISNIRNVISVMKAGVVYDPSALRKIVDFTD